MKIGRSGLWFIFACSFVLAFFLVWFGLYLLTFNQTLSSGVYYLLAIISILTGVFTITNASKAALMVFGSLMLVGFYFIARGNGFLEAAWLSRLAGLASLVAACLVVYITIPRRSADKEE